jgi:hypothetical protein
MNKISPLILVSLLFFAQPSFAKGKTFEIDNAAFLVRSCQEAVDIYSSYDQTSTFAAVRTSLSEALRAGYCIGVLEQYSKTGAYCVLGRSNWFEMAQAIAAISMTDDELSNTRTGLLLEEVYCGK